MLDRVNIKWDSIHVYIIMLWCIKYNIFYFVCEWTLHKSLTCMSRLGNVAIILFYCHETGKLSWSHDIFECLVQSLSSYQLTITRYTVPDFIKFTYMYMYMYYDGSYTLIRW